VKEKFLHIIVLLAHFVLNKKRYNKSVHYHIGKHEVLLLFSTLMQDTDAGENSYILQWTGTIFCARV